jgi:iron complex outermembrane receptor protein
MKKTLVLLSTLCLHFMASAQTPNLKDSGKIQQSIDEAAYIESIEDVIVKAFQRNTEHAHPAFESVKAKDLHLRNMGQDIPMLLQHQTGIVATSDAGNGIGYTGIRVRGSDATRTHISVNGVPINDAESQGTFWVNMPDLASSAKNIHIQRGVGSSVHGAGAFGGSVMIQTGTEALNQTSIDLSYGSFNTRKITAKYQSPITQIKGRNWTYDLRLSHIGSDGFIDRAQTDMYGYMASVQSSSEKGWNHKLLAFGGIQKTFQAWWGIPIEKYRLGQKKPSVNDSQALVDHYTRNIGMYRNFQDSNNVFNSNPNTYNFYLYPNEIDRYQQHHLHYYLSKNINPKLNVNTTLYYTFGQGYFEQFRYNDELSYYGLNPRIYQNDTFNTANLVRRRWLQNHLFGANTHLSYSMNKEHTFLAGIGANQYLGQHFGNVIATGNPTDDVTKIQAQDEFTQGKFPEYYRSSGNKTDLNAFVKWQYQPQYLPELTLFSDAQIRYVNHQGKGTDNDLLEIDFKGEFTFFNPKAGFSYIHKHKKATSIYQGSASVGNREPARSDFVDNPKNKIPKPETLIDYELGYQWIYPNKGAIQCNLYYMDYYNQLVLTGAVNDVGTPLRQNVDRSYRRGLEIGGMLNLWQNQKLKINLIGNMAFSQNIIAQSPASWVDYADYSTFDTLYQNAPIAYSPNTVASAGIQYQYSQNGHKWEFQYLHKFVSQQFLDNTGNHDRSIPAYDFSELQLAYAHPISGHRSVQLKLLVQNVFNQRFINNGYTWGYLYDRQLTQEVFVFPSAPINASFSLSLIW